MNYAANPHIPQMDRGEGYQRDSSLPSIIMTNAEDRDRIFNHLFSRALREVRETPSP